MPPDLRYIEGGRMEQMEYLNPAAEEFQQELLGFHHNTLEEMPGGQWSEDFGVF